MTGPTPVVFIHGLWLHASSWEPWVELFREAGYAPQAPGWPGVPDTVEEARRSPEALANQSIDDVVEHYGALIDHLDAQPILVGHSFGGMIAQKLLGQDRAAAAIAIDAAGIKGVLPVPMSMMRATFPVFRNPANRKRAVSLTAEQFRYAFGNAIPPSESDELFERWTIPAPGKPLFEAAAANVDRRSAAAVHTENSTRGPLLLISGGQDHTVPETITKSTAKQYRHSPAVTDVRVFPDRGHSLTIDHGWREVAQASLDWLRTHGL